MLRCYIARCKNQYEGEKCEKPTRLPLPNPAIPETGQINSPTASEPLLILCNLCWQISRYASEDDLEEGICPGIATAADTPFCCVDFVCGQPNCGIHTKVYMRGTAALDANHAIAYAKKALGGIDAQCPNGHYLSSAQNRAGYRESFRQIPELE